MKKEIKYKKNCPECGREQTYAGRDQLKAAVKANSCCRPCSKSGKNNHNYGKHPSAETKQKMSENNARYWIGKKLPAETKQKISIANSGKNHPNYGKSPSIETRKKLSIANTGKKHSEETKQKLSENNARYWLGKIRSEETRLAISKSNKGKKRTEETKQKMRISHIKYIEINKLNGGQLAPNYNPDGCIIIDWYNMYYDFNFQHAENGGEVCIDGRFPDGLDEARKTIIEIDEKHHYKNGKLRDKDIIRQKRFEELGYEVIRVKI